MSRLSIKYQLIAIISGIAIIILMILTFIITPTIRQINDLKQSINITHEQMEERQNQAQKLRRSIKELNEVKQYSAKFVGSTIVPGSELAVITTLEEMANTYNIDQTLNVSFIEPEKQKTQYQYYQFYFLNQGKFANQLAYLKALEKLSYYIIINNQQWEGKKGATSTSTPVNLRFDGIIYAKPFQNQN